MIIIAIIAISFTRITKIVLTDLSQGSAIHSMYFIALGLLFCPFSKINLLTHHSKTVRRELAMEVENISWKDLKHERERAGWRNRGAKEETALGK